MYSKSGNIGYFNYINFLLAKEINIHVCTYIYTMCMFA